MPQDRVFNIEEELKKLPAKPGVYLMHNSRDEIIYVGKAVVLKNRVRQYFQSSRGKSAKILKMIENIAWFEYIVTDSEMEALVLECNLIKEYRPRYNTMLMDDKAYPFIRVTVAEAFPRVQFAREMKKDNASWFGPYTSAQAVRETIELLHRLFKLRTCTRVLPRDMGKERPCLNYHMGLCQAPCQGWVSEEEYRKSVDSVIRFLNGDFADILKGIEAKMKQASEDLDFEEAIRQRDLLDAVKHVAQKQKITDPSGQEDRDVIACYIEGQEAVVQVFFVRGGKMVGQDNFHMTSQEGTERKEVLRNFVLQFYSGTPFVPRELLLQEEIPDMEMVSEYLSRERGAQVALRVPKRGQKGKFMLLAEKNAKMVYDRDKDRFKREEARTVGAVRELGELLGLSGLSRMEAYDISNISGFESVGSMVVFTEGKPKKNDYRKFRIKTVSGPNDYASMEEVLTRRFEHGLKEREEGRESARFSAFPDLILMDGGKGQVHSCEKVLRKLSLNIPVCGMVKDDHHNTRGLYFQDRELDIDRHSEAFNLITRIQDEAHRFAITYHRGLHIQNTVHSTLEDIPGVGEKRRKALMRKFKSMEEIASASVEDILALDEFNRRSAEQVYAYFHKDETVGDEEEKDIVEDGEDQDMIEDEEDQ